jgi:hypothetical protein
MPEPAATGGKGGSRMPVNEVDADKLWRDRISSELQLQRSWHDEYGFMVANSSQDAGNATQAKASGALGAQTANLDARQLDALRTQLAASTLRSTAQASFTKRPTPELYSDGRHNRRKFKDN